MSDFCAYYVMGIFISLLLTLVVLITIATKGIGLLILIAIFGLPALGSWWLTKFKITKRE